MIVESVSPEPSPQSHSASVYFCGKEQCKSGHSFGPAVRAHYLFHYVASGKGVFKTKTATYHLSAGQGFLIVPGQTTYYEADQETPWTYYWIGFNGCDVPQILKDCGLSEETPIYRDRSGGELQSVMNKIIAAFRGETYDKYAVLSLFYAAAAQMRTPHNGRRGKSVEYVQNALNYIHRNYFYRIRIDDIARYVGLDRTYLFKLFVRDTGQSPQAYLIHYRLTCAERLLTESRFSVTEIAYSCGFRDSSSFGRLFRERYGKTPLAYRRDHF